MSERISRPRPVVAPAGEPLTLDGLPPPDLKRWIARRKAQVVAAVRAGLIGMDQACTRYGITIEEFLSWQHLLDEHGLHGTARHLPAGLSAPGPGRGRCRRAAGRRGRLGTSDP